MDFDDQLDTEPDVQGSTELARLASDLERIVHQLEIDHRERGMVSLETSSTIHELRGRAARILSGRQ